jgi:osmotically-inducible protein OsmY
MALGIFKTKNAVCSLLIALGVSGMPNTALADYCYSNQSFSDSNDSNRNSNASNASDGEIAKKVREKLAAGWFSKGYDQVNVEVNNGNVTLSGSIPSWDDKEKVEKDIRSIDGVKGLSLRLSVEDQDSEQQKGSDKSAQKSDQEIASKIRDKISSGWFAKGFDQVNVQVNNGNVTLQGFVNTQEDKDKVEKEVRNIDGVKNINNQITVQQGKETAIEK